MTYKEPLIYYMSGTGNSYRVAAWIKEAAENKGILTSICSIKTPNSTMDRHRYAFELDFSSLGPQPG